MKLTELGHNFYRLTREEPNESLRRKPKRPANERSVTFLKRGNNLIIMRASLMLSKPEIMAMCGW